MWTLTSKIFRKKIFTKNKLANTKMFTIWISLRPYVPKRSMIINRKIKCVHMYVIRTMWHLVVLLEVFKGLTSTLGVIALLLFYYNALFVLLSYEFRNELRKISHCIKGHIFKKLWNQTQAQTFCMTLVLKSTWLTTNVLIG